MRTNMEITRDTKVMDIMNEYPWIKGEVMKIDDKFKVLDTPLAKIILKKATIADVSEKSGIDEGTIIETITNIIENHQD